MSAHTQVLGWDIAMSRQQVAAVALSLLQCYITPPPPTIADCPLHPHHGINTMHHQHPLHHTIAMHHQHPSASPASLCTTSIPLHHQHRQHHKHHQHHRHHQHHQHCPCIAFALLSFPLLPRLFCCCCCCCCRCQPGCCCVLGAACLARSSPPPWLLKYLSMYNIHGSF